MKTVGDQLIELYRNCDYLRREVDWCRGWIGALFCLWLLLAFIAVLGLVKAAHAERPPLDIPNRVYSHPQSYIKLVDEKDGWDKCGLSKQCLAELAANIGKDTRTIVYFKAPVVFYILGCWGNEVCYGGGPITKLPYVKCGITGADPETEFAQCQANAAKYGAQDFWDEFDFSINYTCQYMRKKAHNRIARVKNPSECYQRLATQSRRECIKDYFNPRYTCGYHAGETKNQWSAWVVEQF